MNLYMVRLRERLVGARLEAMRVYGPSVLRSFETPVSEVIGHVVAGVDRIGKRLVLALEGDLFIVIHLMISGRFTWSTETGPLPFKAGKIQMAAWQWSSGRLTLTEASSRKRAAVYLARGQKTLDQFRRGGLDVFQATSSEFATRIRQPNRTLKRALTDPHTLDGIGNAFSDEVLFAARLSPVKTTGALTEEEVARLHQASKDVLSSWTDRLQQMYHDFPKAGQVTAFRPEFNVHGRFGQPCRVCGAPIQHIVYADNETNYCAICQNEGRLLADRSLSRLLKEDWPKTLDWDP